MAQLERSPSHYGAPVAGSGSEVEIDSGLRAFMLAVYNNMVLGLGLSALVALGINWLAVAGSEAEGVARIGRVPLTEFGRLLYTTPLMWLVALAPLAFIFFFTFRMDRMAAASARMTFCAFAAVMGASLSTILIAYTGASVVQVFFITAASFIATVVNIFLASSALQFAIAALGVLIFAGLTAYDTQKLKEMYVSGSHDTEAAGKMSTLGALTLYLDFINMFQFLLALFGKRN